MADAKIMTFGELFSPTIDVIPDNKAAAVEIEGLDGKDYIKIDTTDGSEAVKLVSSGMDGGVVLGTAALLKTAPDSGEAMKALQISTPSTGGEPYNVAMVRFTQEDKGEGQNDGGWIGLTHQNVLQIGGDCNVYINSPNRNTGILVADAGTSIYKHAELRSSLSVANTSTPGTDAVAIGQSAQAGGVASVSIGRLNNSSGQYGVTAGTGLTASAVKSAAFGIDCTAGHHSATALGFKASTAFIQSLAMVGTSASGVGGAQTMMCVGQVETTDASETYLDESDGTDDLEIFSSPGLAKSQVIHIEATILSVCNSASGAYAVNDFVSRKYNFAIQYTYNSAVAGFIGTSNTGISTGGSMNGSREHVFTDDASGIGSASAGTGIDDKLYFATSTNKVSVKISVTGGEASATVRHVAHITAKTITMD